MRRQVFILLPALMLFAGVLLLTGCEESVDPVLGTDERFTMFGFLNPRADRQAVRVFEIEGRLQQTAPVPLDATVFSENVATGERTAWRDSIVTFSDGTIGHVMYADFRPGHGERHRLVIEDADGVRTAAETMTPPTAAPELGTVLSTSGNVLVSIPWIGAPRILNVEVIYSVKVLSIADSTLIDRRVALATGRVDTGDGGSVRTVVIEPSRDIGLVFQILSLRPGVDDLFLDSIEVRAFVANQEWDPPGGRFDPELLVQPGTFSNVMNGFGFLGGGYFDSFVYEPPDHVKDDAGFTVN